MKILVTFTFGISLKTWKAQGLLDRELVIYKRMVKNGYKVGFLTYGDDTDRELKDHLGGIEVYPVYSYIRRPDNKILRILQSLLIPLELVSIFKKYDIYKTNQMLGSWVAVIAKILYGKRLVVRCGYEWLRNAFRESRGSERFFIALFGYITEFIAYAASNKIIVSAPSISNFIKKAFGPFAYKVVLVPNFIDTESFKRVDTKSAGNRALYVGRVNRVKNLMSLLEALKDSAYGLDIIGSGDHLGDLKKFADKNKVDVRFLGAMPNSKLPAELNRYPVFTLVSHFENNPKSLLEAMACERVVLGSNVEGIRELIEDNTSGILVSPDTDGIRKGLEKAFGLASGKRKTLGKRAREFTVKTSSVDEISKREINVYEELKT